MGILGLGSQDKGPTAAQILAEQRKQANARTQGLREFALRDKQKGVNAQLLGRRNPSFTAPGQSNG